MPSRDAPMVLGVSTRFGQGWPERFWPLLEALPAQTVREAISWRAIEARPGQYSFTDQTVGQVKRLCAMKRNVILVILPRHPDYDGGQSISSPAGQAAFASYIGALAQRFGDCLTGVEIGNEINGPGGWKGATPLDRYLSYTALLAELNRTVKPRYPGVQILGGSTNVVATGFLENLFAAGALKYMDAVVVHPYRPDAANVDWEIERLQAAISSAGGQAPVWATEFGWNKPDAEEGAAYLARMVTLMSAQGVAQAYWFQLVDDKQFPNFGLYSADGRPKATARAFTYFANTILPQGRAVRLSSDSALFHYRFGTARQIVWGAPRSVEADPTLVFKDVTGAPIAPPTQVSDTPFIAEGTGALRFGTAQVLADSLYDYGRAPWTYLGRRGAGRDIVLKPIDTRFTTYIGASQLSPAAINQRGILPYAGGAATTVLTMRYTAPADMQIFASVCLAAAQKEITSERRFELQLDGARIDAAQIGASQVRINRPVRVSAGSTIDFLFTSTGQGKGPPTGYRLRIARRADDAAQCPPVESAGAAAG